MASANCMIIFALLKSIGKTNYTITKNLNPLFPVGFSFNLPITERPFSQMRFLNSPVKFSRQQVLHLSPSFRSN